MLTDKQQMQLKRVFFVGIVGLCVLEYISMIVSNVSQGVSDMGMFSLNFLTAGLLLLYLVGFVLAFGINLLSDIKGYPRILCMSVALVICVLLSIGSVVLEVYLNPTTTAWTVLHHAIIQYLLLHFLVFTSRNSVLGITPVWRW